jgi:hypothetical protein
MPRAATAATAGLGVCLHRELLPLAGRQDACGPWRSPAAGETLWLAIWHDPFGLIRVE